MPLPRRQEQQSNHYAPDQIPAICTQLEISSIQSQNQDQEQILPIVMQTWHHLASTTHAVLGKNIISSAPRLTSQQLQAFGDMEEGDYLDLAETIQVLGELWSRRMTKLQQLHRLLDSALAADKLCSTIVAEQVNPATMTHHHHQQQQTQQSKSGRANAARHPDHCDNGSSRGEAVAAGGGTITSSNGDNTHSSHVATWIIHIPQNKTRYSSPS